MRTAACARGLYTARLRASFCSPSTSGAARPHRGLQATLRTSSSIFVEHYNRVEWATRALYEPRPLTEEFGAAGYSAALRAAKRLGAALGVHYRVDMYLTPGGEPVLGEFTPWGMQGAAHCVIRHSHHGVLDACAFGRLWAKHGQVEGGTNDSTKPPPGFLAAIDLGDQPSRLCRLLMHRQATGGGSTAKRKQNGNTLRLRLGPGPRAQRVGRAPYNSYGRLG